MLVFSGSAHWERGMVAPNARSERFARWHATHSRALLCAARASCAALRADAVQGAWLRAMKAPPPEGVANDPDQLRAWLLCLVRRCSIDLARKERAHAALGGNEVARDSREREERALLVRTALKRLALAHAPMAHLLERHHLDGLPVRDLADELGLTASVVSARLSRARKKLRAILEEMGGGAILERFWKKFGIAHRILTRRAITWCPHIRNRRFTMSAKRKSAGTALLVALLICTMGASTISFDDKQPNPNPGGKQFLLEGKGTYNVDAPAEQGPMHMLMVSTRQVPGGFSANTGPKFGNGKWDASMELAPGTYKVSTHMVTMDIKTMQPRLAETKTVEVTVK
jgi:RNA polymerase sigma factor (sigma-70 family)